MDGLVGGWVSVSFVRMCGGEGLVRVNEWELVCAYTNFKYKFKYNLCIILIYF